MPRTARVAPAGIVFHAGETQGETGSGKRGQVRYWQNRLSIGSLGRCQAKGNGFKSGIEGKRGQKGNGVRSDIGNVALNGPHTLTEPVKCIQHRRCGRRRVSPARPSDSSDSYTLLNNSDFVTLATTSETEPNGSVQRQPDVASSASDSTRMAPTHLARARRISRHSVLMKAASLRRRTKAR